MFENTNYLKKDKVPRKTKDGWKSCVHENVKYATWVERWRMPKKVVLETIRNVWKSMLECQGDIYPYETFKEEEALIIYNIIVIWC